MLNFDELLKNPRAKQALKLLLEYDELVFETDFVASFSPNYQANYVTSNTINKNNIKTDNIKIENSSPKTHEKPIVRMQDAVLKNTENVKPIEFDEAFEDVKEKPIKCYDVDLSDVKTIDDLKLRVNNFNGCNLKTKNTNTVFCDGALSSEILIIGEAPGEEENDNKIPFCGKSGKLLMEALKSIGLHRSENLLITNTVFYRPPLNRNPTDDEIQSCKPFVEKLIEISNIKYIICVGGISLKTYIGFDSISSSRQKLAEIKVGEKAIQATAVYHPSYLLRSPLKKKDMFFDLLWIKENLLQNTFKNALHKNV